MFGTDIGDEEVRIQHCMTGELEGIHQNFDGLVHYCVSNGDTAVLH